MSALPNPWSKDCSCEHHRGPCWIYADFSRRQQLRESFAEHGNLQAYAIEEKDRIAEKLGRMRALGVREIPHSLTEQIERDWCHSPLVFARRRRESVARELESSEKALTEIAFDHDVLEGTARVAVAEKLAALHKRIAELRASLATAEETIARGPRRAMSTEELTQRLRAKMEPQHKAALQNLSAL